MEMGEAGREVGSLQLLLLLSFPMLVVLLFNGVIFIIFLIAPPGKIVERVQQWHGQSQAMVVF